MLHFFLVFLNKFNYFYSFSNLKTKKLKNLDEAVIRSGKSENVDKFEKLKKSLGENRKHLIHIDLKEYCVEIRK